MVVPTDVQAVFIAAGFFADVGASSIEAAWKESLAVLLLTIGIVLAQWPAPIRLGGYEAFRQDPSFLSYIWQDRTFFFAFCSISAYCVVPLVVWFFRIRGSVREESPAG